MNQLKKLLFTSLIVLTSLTTLNAQTWTRPTNYINATLAGASFINANQGWVVGSGGAIYSTTNGGNTWSSQSSGTTNSLSAVHFINANQGWAVGALGTILTTTNGGTTWTAQTSGVSVTLNSVYFLNTTQGWAVGTGGNIIATSNGGTTWTAQASGLTVSINNVKFVSATKGWIVGAGGNIKTTSDGGANWTAQTSGITNNLTSVYYANASQGWAVGSNGTILYTANAGVSWAKQTSNTTNPLSNVFFISATQGWAVGFNGTLLNTKNGGTTWTAVATGNTNTLNFVYFTSTSQGTIMGTNILNVTNNGGVSWTTSFSSNISSLRAVYFNNSTLGWTVGGSGAFPSSGTGTVLITTNGGVSTWTQQTTTINKYLYSVSFVSATQGWAVGVSGTILTTTDGGITWTQQTSPTANDLFSVNFVSANQGWAVGVSGTILTTTNGGTTWTQQTSPTTNQLNGVSFVSATQGWAVGASGTILSTTNGGVTWTQQTSPTTNQLNGVSFVSVTQGYAVGVSGTILTTTNGGATWTRQVSNATNQLYAVSFVSSSQGWAVGTAGTILTTTNGGTAWTRQVSNTTSTLYGISFNPTTNQGCAVGNSGTILLYNNTCAATTGTFTVSACNNYTWAAKGNKVYTASNNTDTIHLTNAGGCDSLVTLNLTINTATASTTNASICNGSAYTFNGKTYTSAGTYTSTLTNAVGCDSIATLVLTVKATSTSSTNASICNGSSYTFNGKTYTTAGTYTATLTNSVGCDSIATLVLTVKASSASTTYSSICPSGSYTFNGKTYTNAGTYTATLTNSVGCDSIATLVLTVKATSTSTTNVSICNGSSYPFNGKTYTTAGTYTATLTNSVGCDSIATLVLTVKATSNSINNVSICNGSSYSFNGKTYTTTGTYTAILTNGVGCDSIATLVLTVKAASTSLTNVSICNGSSYTFNGKTYTTAGTYTATLTNSVGCDSVATLVLSVKTTSTSTTTASICNGSSYTFNGKTYTTAGTYSATLTNAVGCDSIATLVLSVKATSTSTTTESICNGSSYTFNGKTYTTAGTYTATLTNSVGCDSIATLVLTVKATSASTTNASICNGSSYTFNGKKYTIAGTYTATLTNAVGCDSVATLVLTVKATSTSTTNASICNGSSYTFNGSTYNAAGTYVSVLTNSVGCDSTVTLILSIIPSVTPIVTITSTATTFTSGSTVKFTANPTNGGASPAYQWFINGMAVAGAVSNTFITTTLINNDTVTVRLTSSLGCLTAASVVSNGIKVTVTPPIYSVSGNVRSPLGALVPNVTAKLNTGRNLSTGTSGQYNFQLSSDSSYSITLSKNNDINKFNGITVVDIIQIQGLILNKLAFTSPYKIIAADVNGSGSITTLDLLLVKRLILNIDTTFPGNTLWAFVDSSYAFTNPSNPFPYNNFINVAKPSSNLSNQSFIGIKLGDVNWNWDANTLGTNQHVTTPIQFYHDNVNVSTSQTIVTVPIKVRQFKDLLGMQFTLRYNANVLKLKAVDSNRLGIEYGTSHSKEGKISFIWNDDKMEAKTLNDGSTLMNLVFEKVGNVSEEDLKITSDITPIEAVDANFNLHTIVKAEGKLTIEPSTIAESLSITPNPAKDLAVISFSKAIENATLVVYDNSGKAIINKSMKGLVKSYHLNTQSLRNGVYVIKINTTSGSYNEKLLISK